jgi:hypothetical protein
VRFLAEPEALQACEYAILELAALAHVSSRSALRRPTRTHASALYAVVGPEHLLDRLALRVAVLDAQLRWAGRALQHLVRDWMHDSNRLELLGAVR